MNVPPSPIASRTSATDCAVESPVPRPTWLLPPQPRPATLTFRPVLPSVVYCKCVPSRRPAPSQDAAAAHDITNRSVEVRRSFRFAIARQHLRNAADATPERLVVGRRAQAPAVRLAVPIHPPLSGPIELPV